MRAAIYKSTGSWYYAKTQDGKFWNARIKGAFRIEGLTSTNPLAVGDEVELAVENKDDGTAMITDIHKRKNYINRLSPANRHQHHIIASNVDQSLLIATLRDPKTSQGFIDRFLVAGESFHVPSVIIFNKADLYRKKETDLFEERKSMYESVGYRVIGMSLEKEGVPDALRALLGGKTTLVSGHSGVGKSTFINAVFPEKGIRTQRVSGWSGKGMHTTTFAEMYDLPESGGGRIIDTPGIREFGLVDISKQELSHYFPEMRTRLGDCQFNNCLHLDEPNCAIKKALEEGRIYVDRYISYCNLLDSIEVNTY
jgi:ribosome biogenesis GTPase / thiamine phosphate phosphatase